MQLKKLMIEVMVFFVLGCFLCACGKTKDQTRKTTKDANKEIMIGGDNYPPFRELKCSQFPSCVDFTGFNCIQNCVYCYYLSFFSKIALKHRPHYFHI